MKNLFTNRKARKITNKTVRRIEKEHKKQVKEKVRDIKAEIKTIAKKGCSSYIYKIRKYDLEIYNDVIKFFKSQGFRVWNTKEEENIYYHIAW